jgi:hypothetical protein
MPRVEFEPKIPAFERGKTFRALEGASTVIGLPTIRIHKNSTAVRELRYAYKLNCDRHLSRDGWKLCLDREDNMQ